MNRTAVRNVKPLIEMALTETRGRGRHDFATYDDALIAWAGEGHALRWMALETRALTTNTTLWPDGVRPGFKSVGRWVEQARAARDEAVPV